MSRFSNDSLVSRMWDYYFPQMEIRFIMGEADQSITAKQAAHFHAKLLEKGSPQITWEVVPETPHFVTSTQAGAQSLEDALINSCQ